jgi:hypothetical protein
MKRLAAAVARTAARLGDGFFENLADFEYLLHVAEGGTSPTPKQAE